MAKLTSLSKETISLLYKDQSHLFGKLENFLHHQKLFDLLLEGRDFDAVMHVFSPKIDNYVDKVLKAAYPANFLTFVKAVGVYKGFLELTRDKAWFPMLEKNMYARYKQYRDENTNPINAMTFITTTGGQYY